MKMRNKYLSVVAVTWMPCLAVAIGFCLLVVRPQFVRAKQLQERLEVIEGQYEIAQTAAKKEDQDRMIRAVEALRSRVSVFAVEMEMVPDLVLEIAKLADDTGVESFTMRPRGKQGLDMLSDCDLIGEKCIDINFSSSFARFATVLNALERHQPVLFVESFSINNMRLQSSEPHVDIALAMLVEKPHAPEAYAATGGVD